MLTPILIGQVVAKLLYINPVLQCERRIVDGDCHLSFIEGIETVVRGKKINKYILIVGLTEHTDRSS